MNIYLEIDKLDEQAFEIRNSIGIKSGDVNRLKVAAEKFLKLSKLYNELSKKNFYLEYQKLIALANSEHIKYEYETALYIYNYRKSNNLEAIKNINNSIIHIEKAINYLVKAEKIIPKNEDAKVLKDIEYDKKRWTYYKLQAPVHKSSLIAESAYENGEISKAYDLYKIAIDKHLELIDMTKEFYSYLDLNYQRIVEANYLMMYSNYHGVYVKLLDEHNNDEHIMFEIIQNLWNAYSKSINAIKILPEADMPNLVTQSQRKQLDKVLLANRNKWDYILTKCNNDDELTNYIRHLDIRAYNKAINKGDDSILKNGIPWIVFLLIISLIVFGAYSLFGTVGTIISVGCILVIFVIFILVTLRSSNKLNENNFVNLLKYTLDKYFKDFKSVIELIKKS